MKIVVCIRQGLDGEINPFDACAYEAALQIDNAEITLLSMAPESAKGFLASLTRLGAKRAILLSDKAFAGADTLATAYTLSLALKKIKPDLVFCGRQTLVGDTAQTPPMLSCFAELSLITNVMKICKVTEQNIVCDTRYENGVTANFPSIITVERINNLRRPRLTSKICEVEVWSAADIGADISSCGLQGSPTRVISTTENKAGKRKCRFISAEELGGIIELSSKKVIQASSQNKSVAVPLKRVFTVTDAPYEFAKTISDDITVLPFDTAENLAKKIEKEQPSCVLWGSDYLSKSLSARVAALLKTGLCADCTSLETDGETLYMIRPALSGSVIAKIKCVTKPAMATVRTAQNDNADIVVAVGYGAKDNLDSVFAFAKKYNAELAATRKAVDNDIMPYSSQVGLTGKTISPLIYIAVGVSGAVHHIVGMQRSATVIAINEDKNSPIFEYADYGIVSPCNILEKLC